MRESLAATAKKYAVRFYSVCKPVEFEDPMARSLSHSERIVSGQSSHQQPKNGDNAAFNIDYTQRLGAFEVQVAVRTKKDFICHLLFSKLFKGNWPKISTLQSLLERVLNEAKFFQLVKDPPKSPSRPNSRPGSPKRVPLYTPKPEAKVVSFQPEFDLRLPAADTDEEEEEVEGTEDQDDDVISLPPPLSRESSTRLLTIPEHSDIDPAVASASRGSTKANSPMGGSRGSAKGNAFSPKKYTAEEQAAATALSRFMRGTPSTSGDTVPSSKRSSFSSEYSEDDVSSGKSSPIRSTKAKILALGSASAGLQYVRRKSKEHKAQAEGGGLLSYEAAMAIANGGDSSADKAKPYTKKQSAIGVLSRQNAGAGGQGRYLMVDDEEESPLQQAEPPVRSFFPSPIHIQKTNSQTSIPFVAQPSPREPGFALSPKRSTPHKKSSFSAVSEDEEVMGFSPANSHKNVSGIRPVARAVEVTQAGMAFAKNRSSSVTSMPQTPTMVEMLHERQSTGRLSQSERIQGRPSPSTRAPHNSHPSLEMRSKLNIGTLSRQNAGIRGESLLVADSESDDESRPGDKPESVPSQHILDAMASAMSAVSLAETLTNTATAGASTASSSTNTLSLTGASVVTPSPVTTATTLAVATTPGIATSTLADRRPSNATPLDTSTTPEHRKRTERNKVDPDPAAPVAAGGSASTMTKPAPISIPVIVDRSLVIEKPSARVESVVDSTTTSSAASATTSQPAPVAVPVPVVAPASASVAAPVTEPAAVQESAPVPAPVPVVSAFAVQHDSANMGRRMSSAEVLQLKRGLADQLVLTVSRDILEPVPSEYADDFDDFENFSPSIKKSGNGLDDLFEASDYKLDDEL